VAESGDRVVGYLTGCPDSAGFRRARRLIWTPWLLLRIAARRYPWNPDATRVVRQSLGLAPEPERSLRRVLPPSLERDYPAHLHMNVDAEARGQGIGRGLVERYTADLEAAGVAGVHLVCGVAPRPFYQQLGFVDLGALEFRPGVWIFGLGRRLGGAAAGGHGGPPPPL